MGWTHPRRPRARPRGGQSGREKRRDKSFQVQAEKPLGTDSHRTVSKRSRECWFLIGHNKCFVLLCPIGEQHLLSSFREFVHDDYYLATVARFVHRSPSFPNQKRRNYRWVEKRFGCYQQEPICTEKILFLTDHNEKVKKAIAWQGKTTTLHVHHAFLYISLPSLHDYHVKMPNFTFCEGRKQAVKIFSFSLWTWKWLREIQ